MPTTKSKQPKPSIDFEEYKRQGEPNRVAKSQIWKTAIGLQQVDGLQVSDYLIATAKKNNKSR